MSNRSSFALALLLLLLAAFFRLWHLSTLPPGFQPDEISDLRITETVRQNGPQVFYSVNGQGREGLYQTFLAAVTSLTGTGLLGYRLLSVWVGMITLALVYALARRLLNRLAALAALGLLSVGFWPTLLAREIARETFTPLLVAAALLALAVGLPVYRKRAIGSQQTIPYAILGLLLGVGFYIHPIAYLIALFSMVFIAYVLLSRRPLSRRTLSFTSFAIVLMVVIVTPYLISSFRLPDLTGAGRLFTTLNQTPIQAMVNGLGGLFMIGDMNPAHNLPKRPLIDLVSGFLFIAGLLTALRYRRQPRFVLLLVAAVILTPAALLTVNSPNFLAFSALLPVFALFFGLGVSTIYSSLPESRKRRWLRPLAVGIGLCALLVFNAQWTARDLFANWPQLDSVQQVFDSRLGMLAHDIDLTAATTQTVVCTSDLNPPDDLPQLISTQILSLMMNRQDAPLRYVDCGTGLIFSNGGDEQQVILPDPGMLDRVHPYLRNWLTMGQVETGRDLPPDGVIRMNVASPLADTVGRFTTTAPTGYAPESPGGSGPATLPVSFGNNVTFLGYEPDTTPAYAPGGVVTSITYWRVDGPIPSELRFFTHVLYDAATIVAQSGDVIRVKPYQLQPRDVFIQITFVWLPQSIPEGVYSVSVGAYDASSDERLTVFDGDQPRGDRLFLNQITVKAK